MTNDKSLASAQESAVHIRGLPSGKYLEKKVEQELRELLKVQNDVIKQIKKMIKKLESL